MNKDFAKPLLDMYPKAAKYDDENLILTGEMPTDFNGDIVRICDQKLSNNALVSVVDNMRKETPTGRLIILSKSQGKYLKANHPSFIDIEAE
jgi:putative lipoic acid-binding regulatory protein